jgi:hypothetical protein
MRRLAGLAAVAVLVLTLAIVRHAPGAATTTTSGQVITVKAATSTSTTAVVEAWQRTAVGTLKQVYGPITAYIGAQGVGTASESSARS